MKIEHIAMYMNDLDVGRDFFVRYFGGVAGKAYHNSNTGFWSVFVSFDGGTRLELMNRPGMEDAPKPAYRTGYIHIAFSVGSRAKVDELTARLAGDGYSVVSGPRTTGDGYYESCVTGPEDNLIEITE